MNKKWQARIAMMHSRLDDATFALDKNVVYLFGDGCTKARRLINPLCCNSCLVTNRYSLAP
jgi:hypothetical protein